MSYVESLDRVIAPRLGTGAGKVVFVRAHLQLSPDHGVLAPLAAAGLDLAQRWTASPIRRIYPQGGARMGYINLLIEFSGGQAALVSAESSLHAEAAAQILVTGQQGSIRFDEYPEPSALADLTGGRGGRWVKEINSALASGRQIAAGGE